MLRSLTCAAAVAAMALAAPAQAMSGAVATAKVHYKDLDLSTATGVKMLNKRVRNAAREVCDIDGSWETRRLVTNPACVANAVRQAKPKVDLAVAMFEKNVRRAEATAAVTVVS